MKTKEPPSLVQRRERPTFTSGRVVTFSTRFEDRPRAFGTISIATGPFEVNANRYEVVVDYAYLRAEEDFAAFSEAIIRAKAAHLAMRGR